MINIKRKITNIKKQISNRRFSAVGLLIASTLTLQGFAQNLSVDSDINFLKVPAEAPICTPTGVAINSQNHIFVANSGPMKLMEFDENGEFIRELIPGILVGPHGARVDEDDNIWVTDLELHVVLKINPDGQIGMVLGQKGNSGLYDEEREMSLFFKPADVAFGSGGEVYVADGYGNSRIVKFDKDGNFIKAWGEKGSEPGQFDNPHNIIIDKDQKVYVSDRNNKRIQVFDAEGKFLAAWTHLGKPWGLVLTENQTIYMTDGTHEEIYKLDRKGKILGQFGSPGQQVSNFRAAHGIALDSDENIYVTEILNWRVQKLIKKKVSK